MTMPPLPATGASGWRDTWAQAVHNAAAAIVSGRLTDAALRAAFVASEDVREVVRLTQAEYDALSAPDAATMYVVVG